MAPTPVEETPAVETTLTAEPDIRYWTKANIAVTIVFALLALGIFLILLSFYIHQQIEKKKKLEHRKSDKAGLLANEDKSSMFSRQRGSSVTLYVDSEAEAYSKRASTETMSLVPLHATPTEESSDPTDNNVGSTGSGVSVLSRAGNTNTTSSILLSPMLDSITPSGEEGDLGIRPAGRPRSTSSASQKARYYETTPTMPQMPPIPKIIRTPSDNDEMR